MLASLLEVDGILKAFRWVHKVATLVNVDARVAVLVAGRVVVIDEVLDFAVLSE